MYIYKLRYTDKETAIADLLAKQVYVELENLNKEITLSYGQGIQAVVELGLIILENGVYDSELNEITAPIFADGYHFDVMSEKKIDFGTARVTPTKVKHAFLGFNTNEFNKL